MHYLCGLIRLLAFEIITGTFISKVFGALAFITAATILARGGSISVFKMA
jgi:membrane protein implicated in regulation of membrane protease activity